MRAILLVALNAYAMTGNREKALEAGCDDTKSIELHRLLDKFNAFPRTKRNL